MGFSLGSAEGGIVGYSLGSTDGATVGTSEGAIVLIMGLDEG